MEEDEEVVMKHSALYTHLVDHGFNDFETAESKETNKHYSEKDTNAICGSEHFEDFKESCNFEHLVDRILTSHLVFNDDITIVKHFTVSKTDPENDSMSLNYKLFCKISAAGVLCLSCSYYALKSSKLIYLIMLGLTPLGIYTARHLFNYYTKYKNEKLIEQLIQNLKNLSLIVQKSIHFIQEYEVFTYNNIPLNKIKNSLLTDKLENNDTRYQSMNQLRLAVHKTLRYVILNFKSRTSILVKKFPLKESADSLNFYLAFLDDSELHCSNESKESISIDALQKMKYVYLLLQSEFLKRLCLNFNPSIWSHLLEMPHIFDLVEELSLVCAKQYIHLKDTFLVYYTFEKPYNANNNIQTSNTDWVFKEAYTKICSVSLNLQSTLRKSRDIEEFLENSRLKDNECGDLVLKLDTLSEGLLDNYMYCNKVLEDFQKYVSRLKPKEAEKENHPSVSHSAYDVSEKEVFVGHSDFNPRISDEIFIGISTNDKTSETEDYDVDFIAQKKCSKMLINELKMVLYDKAQEWKEREKVALKNKNLEDDISDRENEVEIVDKVEKGERRKLKIEVDSENSDESGDDSKSRRLVFPTGSTFAETIAQASSHWGLKSDEYFMGDDSEGELC